MTNNYYISFDISTTNVGISLWDESGVLVELKHLALIVNKSVPQEERDIEKAVLFTEYISTLKKQIEELYDANIIEVFVEAPLSNTPKNINTTALLLGFNGMCKLKLYEVFGVKPKLISIYDSRRLFCPELIVFDKRTKKHVLRFPEGYKSKEKKEYIRQKVATLEPNIEWFYTRNNTIKDSSYDMSDSYCVGISGLITMGIIDQEKVFFNP